MARLINIDNLPVPVILVAPNRRLRALNGRAVKIFGKDWVGVDLTGVISDPALVEACHAVLEGAEQQECAFEIEDHKLRTFQATLSAETVFGGRGVCIALFETTRASEAEKMRSAFVANVSHELRSPLTTLIAAVETLQGRAGDDPDARKRFIELMAHETDRMHRIVNDLLALSATEANEHIAPTDPVSLEGLLREITNVHADKAAVKAMHCVLKIDPNLPPVAGEQDELYHVFNNLIDNAIKYGDAESDLTIKSRRKGNRIVTSVNNTGKVIEAKHLSRLTERFYRVDKSRSRDMGGTGLGLAIVKHLVNRHKGTLKIESTAKEGTTFTVALPILEKFEDD